LKRTKRRYLSLQFDSDCAPDQKEFVDAVWHAVTQLYGEYGASLTNFALIDYNSEAKAAVVRTSLSTSEMFRAALASITRIEGKEVTIHVLAVSGTIKALLEKSKM
jgi:RNase P/RNase MRP subunit POP5